MDKDATGMYCIPDRELEKCVYPYLLGRIPGRTFVVWFIHEVRPGMCKEKGFTLILFQFLLEVFIFLYSYPHEDKIYMCE